jgi:Inner membrane protein YgaP-like, transmembrane domain
LDQAQSINWRFAVNVDRAVLTLAGSMVLISLALAWLVSPYWLVVTAFVGANLFQAAFTGFCPAVIILRKLGLKEGPAFESLPAKA